MTHNQAAWLLRIGKMLREREEKIAPEALPRSIRKALDRLASREREAEEPNTEQRAGGWRA
jgi:hypothetical protein